MRSNFGPLILDELVGVRQHRANVLLVLLAGQLVQIGGQLTQIADQQRQIVLEIGDDQVRVVGDLGDLGGDVAEADRLLRGHDAARRDARRVFVSRRHLDVVVAQRAQTRDLGDRPLVHRHIVAHLEQDLGRRRVVLGRSDPPPRRPPCGRRNARDRRFSTPPANLKYVRVLDLLTGQLDRGDGEERGDEDRHGGDHQDSDFGFVGHTARRLFRISGEAGTTCRATSLSGSARRLRLQRRRVAGRGTAVRAGCRCSEAPPGVPIAIIFPLCSMHMRSAIRNALAIS